MSKYWALIDTHTSGESRFVTKQIEYSAGADLPKDTIGLDKSYRNIVESREVMLDAWERNKVAQNIFTPSKDPFLCVTGHSRDPITTFYQPWYQVEAEVIRRGLEFHG